MRVCRDDKLSFIFCAVCVPTITIKKIYISKSDLSTSFCLVVQTIVFASFLYGGLKGTDKTRFQVTSWEIISHVGTSFSQYCIKKENPQFHN